MDEQPIILRETGTPVKTDFAAYNQLSQDLYKIIYMHFKDLPGPTTIRALQARDEVLSAIGLILGEG